MLRSTALTWPSCTWSLAPVKSGWKPVFTAPVIASKDSALPYVPAEVPFGLRTVSMTPPAQTVLPIRAMSMTRRHSTGSAPA